MAKESGRKSRRSGLPEEPNHDEQLRARRELGIEGLPDGEVLMNTATFSRVHIEAALSRALADGGAPGQPAPADELLLEEITTELPVRDLDRCPNTRRPTDPAEVADLEREMVSARESPPASKPSWSPRTRTA